LIDSYSRVLLNIRLQKKKKKFSQNDIADFKKNIESVEVSQSIYEYICRIVFASRNSEKYPEISYGGSPRASLALLKTSKVLAAISGRDFVLPEDVKQMAH
jgi:MoxR-like ATPase